MRCFVPLLAHKHYIEHLSNSSYRFIEENYVAIIIVIELSPSPRLVVFGQSQCSWSVGQSEQTALVGRRDFVENEAFERGEA